MVSCHPYNKSYLCTGPTSPCFSLHLPIHVTFPCSLGTSLRTNTQIIEWCHGEWLGCVGHQLTWLYSLKRPVQLVKFGIPLEMDYTNPFYLKLSYRKKILIQEIFRTLGPEHSM